MLRLCSILLPLTALSSSLFAQRSVVNQNTEWFTITSSLKVHSRINILAEGQFRYIDDFQPMQFQIRTGVDLTLNKHWSIVPLAYVYTWNPIYGKQPAQFVNNEHRIWQQVNYSHKTGRFKLGHRVRLEQRYIKVHTDTSGEIVDEGYDLRTNRIRYRFVAILPLNSYEMKAGTIFANFYEEIFMSWGEPVTYHKPDQNRIFAGVGYQFSKQASVQAGFFYQMLIKANGTRQENNIGIHAQLNLNLDLRKQQELN